MVERVRNCGGRIGHLRRTRHSWQGRAVCFAVVVGVVLLGGARPALASSPVSWSSPVRVDDQPPFALSATLTGVSCPTTSLCVAVDGVGDVLISTDPTGGTLAWNKAYAGENSTGVERFTGISCPSTELCVAVDSAGDVVTSTAPAGGAGAWSSAEVNMPESDGERIGLEAVSCPSSGLCVATDDHGDILTSSDPTAGAGAWTRTNVEPHDGLRGVSCPSVRLCVAVASEGDIVTSTDPTDGAGAWTETDVDAHELLDVSCASETLCIVGDSYGNVLASSDPAGGASAWTSAHVGASLIEHVSCTPGLCVALDGSEVITSTEPTGGTAAWTSASIEIGGDSLDAASCPAANLCVLGDSGSAVVSSTEPTRGAAAWTVSRLDVGSSALRSVSCAGASLCVGVDRAGNVVTTTDPSGGADAWTEGHMDSNGGLESVSCPTAELCVAVDSAGNVVTSTDPTGGAGAWNAVDVDGARRVTNVSCPALSRLCVAIDSEGGLVTSTDPTGGAGAWTVTEMGEAFGFLIDLSCPSVKLCVAVNEVGDVMTVTEPGEPGGRTWATTHIVKEETEGVFCPSETLCLVGTLGDNVLTSTDPTGGADAWTSTYVENLNGLGPVSCATGGLCVVASFAGNGSPGNVLASTNPTGGAGSWVSSNVYGLPVRLREQPFELYITDLTGVSCAPSLCVVIDTQGDVIVGTLSTMPVNVSPPVAFGTPTAGQILSCSMGSWTGYPPPTFTYLWLRDGSLLDGANASTYMVQADDQGHGLACQVTAMNGAGSESVTSNTLQVSPAQASGAGSNPGVLTSTVSNAFVLNGMESVAWCGTIKATLSLPGPGAIQIVGKASSAQLAGALHTKKKRKKTLVIARVRLSVSKAGRIVVTLAPTASAKAILVRRGKLRATVRITYTPKGGTPRSIVRTVTFRLKRRR